MTPEQLTAYIDAMGEAYVSLAKQCDNLEDLEKIRISAVGKNGFFTQLQRELGKVIKEDRA